MKKNNFKSLMQAAVLICTPLAIASCDDVFGDVDNPVSSHISIKDAAVNLVLHADSTAKATYTRTAIAATGAQIEYSSTKPEIATVDAKTGKITAVNGGECEIIAKATGLDSRGNKTYQEEEVRFPVKVTDYRARVDLIEGAEIPVYNSADSKLAEIDMSKIVKAWPADVTLTYEVTNPDAPAAAVVSTGDLSKIVLTGNSGTAKVKATIATTLDLGDYERKSFKDNQKSEEFEITVKEGVAYIAGYELKNNVVTPVRKTMFKDYNGEKYTTLKEVVAAQPSGDLTLKAGWYVVDDATTSIDRNIRVTGNVNLIMSNDLNIQGNNILDQSAEKSYELNIISDYDNQYNKVKNITKIQDFKKVAIDQNVSFNNTTDPNFNNIETLDILGSNISNWKFKNIGTLGIAKASLSNVNFDAINVLNITDATQLNNVDFKNITETLNVNNNEELFVRGLTFEKVATLNLAKITNVDANSNSYYIGFVNSIGTLNLTNSTLLWPSLLDAGNGESNVTFGTVNLKKSTARVNQIVLADGGAITLDDAVLDAYSWANDKYAVKGNVVVNKGTFYAQSAGYHAVKGNLSGTTFYESSVGGNNDDDWSAITGTSSQEPFVKGKKE